MFLIHKIISLATQATVHAIVATLFIFGFAIQADAYVISKIAVENNEDFVVEPGKTEIFLNPGETITRNISVTNRTNRPLDFTVSTEDFIGTDRAETAVMLLTPGSDTPYPLSEYVSSEIQSFTLEFGEKITFQVKIQTPDDIEPGGHYGAIIISNQSPGQVDASGNEVRSGTRLTSRIGSLILMRINGDVYEAGHLDSFDVSGPSRWIYQTIPTSFNLSFKNEGTVHLVPYGEINIKNIFGTRVAQIPVDAFFALPESTRYQTLSWPGKKFALGFYSAEIELYKGYGDQSDREKIKFFVLPLVIVIPVVVLFVLIFGLIYVISKRFEIKRK